MLEAFPFLYIDTHIAHILSWWLPQLIETLSALLLLSDISSDGTKQSMSTGIEAFNSFLAQYLDNLVLVIYLLLGGYMLEDPLMSMIAKKDVEATEEDLHACISDKIVSVTSLVRAAVNACKSSNSQFLNRNNSFYGMPMEEESDVTWKTICTRVPHTFASSNYLFTLSLPEEMRFHFGLDNSSRVSTPLNNIVGGLLFRTHSQPL